MGSAGSDLARISDSPCDLFYGTSSCFLGNCSSPLNRQVVEYVLESEQEGGCQNRLRYFRTDTWMKCQILDGGNKAG